MFKSFHLYSWDSTNFICTRSSTNIECNFFKGAANSSGKTLPPEPFRGYRFLNRAFRKWQNQRKEIWKEWTCYDTGYSLFQVFSTSCLLYHLLLPKQLPSEWLCTEAELLSLLDTIRSGQRSPQHRTCCLSRLPPPRYFLLATSSQGSAASVRRPIFHSLLAIHTERQRGHFISCGTQSEIPVRYSESLAIWPSLPWSRKGWERKLNKWANTPRTATFIFYFWPLRSRR